MFQQSPRPGEILRLNDGRKFRFTQANFDTIGWWWKAVAVDGLSTLAGNFDLERKDDIWVFPSQPR